MNEVIAELEATAQAQDAAGVVLELDPTGLTLNIDVTTIRVGRKRCPRCKRLRVLHRLEAFSADQPVGYGQSRCLECAGLRPKGR